METIIQKSIAEYYRVILLQQTVAAQLKIDGVYSVFGLQPQLKDGESKALDELQNAFGEYKP